MINNNLNININIEIEPFRCSKCLEIPKIEIHIYQGLPLIYNLCNCNSNTNLDANNFLNKFTIKNYVCFKCKKILFISKEILICENCKKIFCSDCKNLHLNKFNNHLFNNLREREILCNFHKEYFSSYCINCKRNLCEKCKKETIHKFHKFIYDNSNSIIKNDNLFYENLKTSFKNMQKYNEIKKILFNFVSNKEIIEKINKSHSQFNKKNEYLYKILENIYFTYQNCKPHFNYIILENVLKNQEFDLQIPNYNINKNNYNEIMSDLLKDFYNKSIIIQNKSPQIENINLNSQKYTLNNKKLIKIITLENSKGICVIKLLKDNRFAAGLCEGKICVFSQQDYKLQFQIPAHEDLIINLIEFKQKDFLISCSKDCYFKFWKIIGNEYFLLKQIIGHKSCVENIILLKNGLYCSCSFDKTIKVWHPETFACLKTINIPNYSKCFIEINNCLVPFVFDYAIYFYDINHQFECIGTIKKIDCYSPKGMVKISEKKFVIGGYENLYIIDAIAIQIEAIIKAHNDTIWALLYLNDGTLLTSGNDKSIKQWDLLNYKCLSVKNNASQTGIMTIEMLKDQVLVSSSYNTNEIRVWK